MPVTPRFDPPMDHSGIGFDNPCGSLPAWNILSFFDFSMNSSYLRHSNPLSCPSGIGQEHKKPKKSQNTGIFKGLLRERRHGIGQAGNSWLTLPF